MVSLCSIYLRENSSHFASLRESYRQKKLVDKKRLLHETISVTNNLSFLFLTSLISLFVPAKYLQYNLKI